MPIDFAAVIKYLTVEGATVVSFQATYNSKEYQVKAYRVDKIIRVDLEEKEKEAKNV